MVKPVVAVVGPTASGKTELGLYLAKELNGEIISADSMQVYKGLDIGTAKIEPEKRVVTHYLLDVVGPNEDFTVANYKDLATSAIEEIRSKGKRPIFVGGTGLYFQTVLDGLLFPEPQRDGKLRKRLLEQAEELGNEYLYRRLLTIDEESARRIHPNDIRRIVRALEVYIKTGTPLSKLQAQHRVKKPRYETVWVGLTLDRKILYERIDQRVDEMVKSGLIEEVTKLYLEGLEPKSTAYQALGYKEIIWYLKGLATLDEAVRILKRDTRHYAKRQLSWFRRNDRIKWFDYGDYKNREELYKDVVSYIKSREK